MGASSLEAKLSSRTVVATNACWQSSACGPGGQRLCRLDCSWAIYTNKRSMCAQVFLKTSQARDLTAFTDQKETLLQRSRF